MWPINSKYRASAVPGCTASAATCCTPAIGGTPGAPCGTTGGKRANSCVSNPTTKSSRPGAGAPPPPGAAPAPKPTLASPLASPAMDTDWVTDTVATLSPESAGTPRPQPRPPRPLALPPRPLAPHPLAPRPLGAPSISLHGPEHEQLDNKHKSTNTKTYRGISCG
ncbi:unnamed protein product [Microthlaspi erraticum]|uniref:Uncharacterized protein n=1 Tax=Microthlaspi erraticum TaxID=1685480 RepID=A0A6D2J3S3_9BRAS|nr:unnamed protein product [Microthlaspi erraticum]